LAAGAGTKRRDIAGHRRRRHPGLTLLNLEPTHFLGRCGVRRAPQEDGEARDDAQIIVLGLSTKPAHIHVLDHPLAQIDRLRRKTGLIMRWLIRNGRSHHPQDGPPKRSNKTKQPNQRNAITTSTNPAQRVRSSAHSGQWLAFRFRAHSGRSGSLPDI
jgi:hypothetical protein